MEFPIVFLTAFLLNQPAMLLAESQCTIGFSVVAPELAVPGKTTAVLVTLHGPTSLLPVNVTLKLTPSEEDSGQRQPIETTQEISGHGIVPLEVPADATGSFRLQTLVNCTGEEGEECDLQSTSQMRLVGPVRDVIIRPARHAYSPGETISFWVLALDHDLQIAEGVMGSVSVKDPAGTKVAVWDQVQLDEGPLSFSLPLSPLAVHGRWTVQVEAAATGGGGEFQAPLEVAPGVAGGGGLPDVAAAEEHYVELRFGREMRRRYKPGLPFTGKVEAMSTEKSVRVRVRVYDNTTSIYSQDIEISNGEGTFTVPAILADSDVITLQAELVSVESKEIESHYVLAREPIQKWNSTSDCYLLIEGVEHTLQPDEEAHVAILSTCPCERDLHYVITTDGRVTDWAQRRYEDPVLPLQPNSNPGAICRLHFSFNVRSIMAPVSQLLVYYVTSQGEPVSDVISFDVKLLNRQVYVNMEEKEWWLPGQMLDLEVVAEPSSLVCLLGGRAAGTGDIKFDPRISEEREPAVPVTGSVDFLEAGVSFFQRQCVRMGETGMSAVSYRQRGSGAGPSNRRRPPESLVGGTPFEQLWMWRCFNYTSEVAASGVRVAAPQEAGRWSLWALTVAPGQAGGLRFSTPLALQVFRPLQADFRLPPSMRIRETLEVDIRIGNNINQCMDVTALLALSEGAQFLSNGLLYVTERLRLGPHGATSLVVRLLVTTPGIKNMTVEVNGYTSSTCEGSERPINSSLSGAVVRSATVEVYPEGTLRTDTESAYFCANENLVVSPSSNFRYEWRASPRSHEGVVLEVRIQGRAGPVTVALAESRDDLDRMYHITIGDRDNEITWIGKGQHGYGIQLATVETPGILSEDNWRTFWITWEKNIIAFGNGSTLNNNTLLKRKMDKKIKIKYLGFASSWGCLAEFRMWNFNEEAGYSQVLHLDTPHSVVPGSEWGRLLVAGGLATPPYTGEGDSRGGLAGALASLVPVIGMNHKNDTEKRRLLDTLPGKLQHLLSYRKPDSSFSEHPLLSSHRATVCVLGALAKLQRHGSIDPELVQATKGWVQGRQEDDGRWSPLPGDRDVGREVGEGEDEGIEVTAETMITLYEIGIESDTDSDSIQKAKVYLENTLPKLRRPETVAAVTLALVLVRSAAAAWAVERLRNASTSEDGEFSWPRRPTMRDAGEWALYEQRDDSGGALREPVRATVEEYRASLHSLQTFSLIGEVCMAESTARYLFYRSHMLDRHPELLYAATQAFEGYGRAAGDRHRALTVALATSGMELTDTLEIRAGDVVRELHLPSLPTKVFVYATGAGCATIQGKTTYSTYSSNPSTSLLEMWSGVVQEILPDRSSVEEIEGKLPLLKLKTCFRWKGPGPSGVLRLEVTLFSGFELTAAPPQLAEGEIHASTTEMQHGHRDNQLWAAVAGVTGECPVCLQYEARSQHVIAALRPAHARVYPAGREDLAAEVFFHTKIGSSLLKSITEDDFITWFGKNISESAQPSYKIPDKCIKKSSTTTSAPTTDLSSTENIPLVTSSHKITTENSQTTKANPETTTKAEESVTNGEKVAAKSLETAIERIETTSKDITTESTIVPNTQIPLHKIEILSVATYTINVDNNSIANLSKETEDKEVTLSTTESSTSTVKTPVRELILEVPEETSDENNLIPNIDDEYPKVENKVNEETLNEINNTNINSNNLNDILNGKIVDNTLDTTVTTETSTKSAKDETKNSAGTTESYKSIPKHINTNIHPVPNELFEKEGKEDEDLPATFAPEIKNDKYVLLDKEQLWGMLKEVVDDEMSKKSNTEIAEQKIRTQGLT